MGPRLMISPFSSAAFSMMSMARRTPQQNPMSLASSISTATGLAAAQSRLGAAGALREHAQHQPALKRFLGAAQSPQVRPKAPHGDAPEQVVEDPDHGYVEQLLLAHPDDTPRHQRGQDGRVRQVQVIAGEDEGSLAGEALHPLDVPLYYEQHDEPHPGEHVDPVVDGVEQVPHDEPSISSASRS